MDHSALALWIAQQLRSSDATMEFPELRDATVDREDPIDNATDITITLPDGNTFTISVLDDSL